MKQPDYERLYQEKYKKIPVVYFWTTSIILGLGALIGSIVLMDAGLSEAGLCLMLFGIPFVCIIAYLEANLIACLMSPKIVATDCLIELKKNKNSVAYTSVSSNAQSTAPKTATFVQSSSNETKNNESEEKAKMEIFEQAKLVVEQRKEELIKNKDTNGKALLNYEKTLSDHILDALKYQNDATMIGYLRSLKNEKIDEILKQPADTIRESIIKLL